jgi:hypothetical protein
VNVGPVDLLRRNATALSVQCLQPADVAADHGGIDMTSLQPRKVMPGMARSDLLRPWPVLVPLDKAPPPKPLVMGGTIPPTAKPHLRTHCQASAAPVFPIEPANDPVKHLLDDDRTAMTLLALVLCVTVTIALLGFGLQVMQ